MYKQDIILRRVGHLQPQLRPVTDVCLEKVADHAAVANGQAQAVVHALTLMPDAMAPAQLVLAPQNAVVENGPTVGTRLVQILPLVIFPQGVAKKKNQPAAIVHLETHVAHVAVANGQAQAAALALTLKLDAMAPAQPVLVQHNAKQAHIQPLEKPAVQTVRVEHMVRQRD